MLKHRRQTAKFQFKAMADLLLQKLTLKGEHLLRFINDRCSKLGFRRVIALLLTPLMLDVLPVVPSHTETVVLMSRVNTLD